MAHPDLDSLLNAILPFAKQMLARHAAFHPFGATMSPDGQIALAAGMTGSEQPDADEVIQMLLSGFKTQAARNEILAAAVCFDGLTVPPGLTEKADSICAQLEHASGDRAAVFLPYRKGWLGRVRYGTLFAAALDSRVFAEGKAGEG